MTNFQWMIPGSYETTIENSHYPHTSYLKTYNLTINWAIK